MPTRRSRERGGGEYQPAEFEPRLQARWERHRVFRTRDDQKAPKARLRYVLDMFPYPSGEGLHVGHVEGYTASDVVARYERMRGRDVLHPMGWDAFGLPAENAAIKQQTHPRTLVAQNVARFRQQLKRLGFSYDWSKEVNTTDPAYYRWTQWIFLKLFHLGLAYEAIVPINWCPSCKTGLANEEVVEGKCERCGTPVGKKDLRQWMLRITKYADRLLRDLDGLDWPEGIKELQRNWIGRSEGTEVTFEVSGRRHFVLLHGFRGGPEKNFFPWLESELKRRGHSVEVPALPNAANPNIQEQVQYVLKHVTFDENTVVLGHSLGSAIALKVVERLERPVRKLITAGGFLVPKFEDHPRPFERAFDWTFDAEKIRERAGSVIILRAANDSVVPSARADEIRDRIGGTIIDFTAAADHICGKEEPKVLEVCRDLLPVFTTRADTLFGATYVVLSPEHLLVGAITSPGRRTAVVQYASAARSRSDLERTALEKEKTGVDTGARAINPANGREIPIWVADYVLASYGTGAIMAVPAHDGRDFQFAKKYGLPIQEVVRSAGVQGFVPAKAAKSRSRERGGTGPGSPMPLGDDATASILASGGMTSAFVGDGVLVNSGDFSGLSSAEARPKITAWLEKEGFGRKSVQFKLRDWVFSRQRYWGEPIPIVHCKDCGAVPVPEEDLPVRLPDVKRYEPTGTGESPLAAIASWVKTRCPRCRGPARRETNTMPQWAGSCWYFLRFCDPKNRRGPWSWEALERWMPVDLYVGGAEHAVLHLLYARFWMKALFDGGYVPVEEPFAALRNQGLILGPDGAKMSKSRGNVVSPDEIVERYGADTLRLYELFLGPLETSKPWDPKAVPGVHRFLRRVWRLGRATGNRQKAAGNEAVNRALHKLIKKVGEDIEALKFNTAIAAMMEFVNLAEREGISAADLRTFLVVLSPFAPHIAEELWQRLDGGRRQQAAGSRGRGKTLGTAAEQPWPAYDPALVEEGEVTVVVQVNGKLRDSITVARDLPDAEVRAAAERSAKVQKWLAGKRVTRVVVVKNRLVNFVTV